MVLQLAPKRIDYCSLLADVHEFTYCCFAASSVTLETTACERPLGSSGSICQSHRSLTSWSRAQNGPQPLCGLADTIDTEQLLDLTVNGCSKISTPLQAVTLTGEEQVRLGMSLYSTALKTSPR